MEKMITISYNEYESLRNLNKELYDENQEYKDVFNKDNRVILVEKKHAPYFQSLLSTTIKGDEDKIKQYGIMEAKKLTKDLEELRNLAKRIQQEKQALEKEKQALEEEIKRLNKNWFKRIFNF